MGVVRVLEREHHGDEQRDEANATRQHEAAHERPGGAPAGRQQPAQRGAVLGLDRHRSHRAGPHWPTEKSASRSWREKAAKATMVWVRVTPDRPLIAPVTTSASCSWSGTRTIATKSQSPVTEYASATPSMSASSPPSVDSASRSASIRTTALVIVMAMGIIRTAARSPAPAVRRPAAASAATQPPMRRPSLQF